MLRQTTKCALLALAPFCSATFLLAIIRRDAGDEILLRVGVFQLLIVVATITTVILYAVATGAAALIKQSSLVAASISGILGWITASGLSIL
jgi:hypothetical protein